MAGVMKALGANYVVKAVLNAIGLGDIVDRLMPMEKGDLSHGQVVEALVMNRLTSPRPLLHISEWAEESGMEEAFGINPDKLNDDRLGRTLDAISECMGDIQCEVSMSILRRFEIEADRVIWDITSIYFEGDYDESEIVDFGYNRDAMDEVLRLYKNRNLVENRMCNLKHDIRVRPVFLHNDNRIKSAALISVLALTVYSLIEWLAQEKNINLTGRKVMNLFTGIALLRLSQGHKRSIFYVVGGSVNNSV
jgi:hypothetical protein